MFNNDENDSGAGSDTSNEEAKKPLEDADGNVDTEKVQDVASDEADKINDEQSAEDQANA